MSQPEAKRRRYATACDACHRRKVACHWRPPACPDCAKKGIECTFTREEPDLTKTRRTREQLDVVTARLQRVEALLEQREAPKVGNDGAPPGLGISSYEDNAVQHYFEEVNYYFPIFSRAIFQERESRSTKDDWWPICNELMRHSIQSQNDKNAPSFDSHVDQVLKLVVKQPSWFGLQTSILLLTCLRDSSSESKSAAVTFVLATAVRLAQTLRLHELNNVPDLSAEERLEGIRLFWCLYILDREYAMRSGQPLLINEDDIWIIDPKKLSDDRLALVGPADKLVNVFTARQRLAVIQGRIYACHFPTKARLRRRIFIDEDAKNLNADLRKWKDEWFDYGSVDAWGKESLIKLVQLQYAFFHSCIHANPGLRLVESRVERIFAMFLPTVAAGYKDSVTEEALAFCLETAQETLHLATAIRQGEMRFMTETLQYVLPALALVLYHPVDHDIAERWLPAVGHLAAQSRNEDLLKAYEICQSLK